MMGTTLVIGYLVYVYLTGQLLTFKEVLNQVPCTIGAGVAVEETNADYEAAQ